MGVADGSPSSAAQPEQTGRGLNDEVVALENEFARVLLSLDRAANSPRLRIEVIETGEVGYLDALSLERLAGLSQDELAVLFNIGHYGSAIERKEATDG
jgi:hypothetical protein